MENSNLSKWQREWPRAQWLGQSNCDRDLNLSPILYRSVLMNSLSAILSKTTLSPLSLLSLRWQQLLCFSPGFCRSDIFYFHSFYTSPFLPVWPHPVWNTVLGFFCFFPLYFLGSPCPFGLKASPHSTPPFLRSSGPGLHLCQPLLPALIYPYAS